MRKEAREQQALMSSTVCSIVSMYTKGIRELLVRAEVAVWVLIGDDRVYQLTSHFCTISRNPPPKDKGNNYSHHK